MLRILTNWKYKGCLRMREAGASSWRTLDGDFLLVWACNMKWLSADAQIAPHAEFGDGCADLVVIRHGVASRSAVLCAFLDLASGKHTDAPFVEYYKVEEFELRPEERTADAPGYVGIDGEPWALADTRVKLLPRKLTLMGGPSPVWATA